jgi:hypothetical protein
LRYVNALPACIGRLLTTGFSSLRVHSTHKAKSAASGGSDKRNKAKGEQCFHKFGLRLTNAANMGHGNYTVQSLTLWQSTGAQKPMGTRTPPTPVAFSRSQLVSPDLF